MSALHRALPAPLAADLLLRTLARVPLVSARDLVTLTGAGEASVRRRLRAATEAGLVEWVTPPADRLLPRRLSYLTAAGLRAAAQAAGQDPVAYTRDHDLTEAALLGRLARLEHLALSRAVLLDLLRALPTVEPGAAVVEWRPWPLALPTPLAGQGGLGQVVVDGAAVLRRVGQGGDGVSAVVLLWDAGEGDVASLRPRLAGLLRARAAWRGLDPARQTGFPTILLISPTRARAGTALLQAALVAHAAGAAPLALLASGEADAVLASPLGPLDPALPWHAPLGPPGSLPASLPLLTPGLAWTLAEARGAAGWPATRSTARGGALPCGGYTRRSRAAWAGAGETGQAPGTRAALTLLGLALPSDAGAVLRLVARAPFLDAAQIAVLLDDEGRAYAPLLRDLCARGLCRRLPVGSLLVSARDVFVLTWPGLRLLALQAGAPPRAYLRATGALALPRRPDGTGGRMAGLTRLSAHTCLIQEIHVSWAQDIRRAATDAGGAGGPVELVWRGEWARAQRFWGDGAWRALYPDALVRLDWAGETATFFLEVDRGTYAARLLAPKLAAYQAYRTSGAWRAVAPAFPTVLVVTSGEGRLRALLDHATRVADAALTTPLPLLVATLEGARAHGPLGPIWRAAPSMPPGPLLEQVRMLSDRGPPAAAQAPVVGGSAGATGGGTQERRGEGNE